MEFLKELLKDFVSEDKLETVIETINKEAPKHIMPKGKFNEINEELKIARQQITEQKGLVEQLTAKANSVEEYQTKLNEWQSKYNELESNSQKQISQITKKGALKDALVEAKAHKDAIDLLVNSTDIDSIELKDGKIDTSYIEKLKTERSGLFQTVVEDSEVKDGDKDKKPQNEDDRLRQLFGL